MQTIRQNVNLQKLHSTFKRVFGGAARVVKLDIIRWYLKRLRARN